MSTTLPTLAFPRHAAWEDFVTMGLGFLIIISPWIAGVPDTTTIGLNTGLVGILIFGLAAIELSGPQRWEEWLSVAAGAWVTISPWLLGYSDHATLAFLQVGLGAMVVLMAVLELWQDWNSPAEAQ